MTATPASNPTRLTAGPDPKPVEAFEWVTPNELPAEGIELLNVLRRWPAVPESQVIEHAIELTGGKAAAIDLLGTLLAKPSDARRQPYISRVDGHKVVWVTSAGHRACGSQRRTSAPGLAEIDHTVAMAQVAYAWKQMVGRIADTYWGNGLGHEVEVEVTPGSVYVNETLGGTNEIDDAVRYASGQAIGTEALSVKARTRRAWNSGAAVPDLVVSELWYPIIESEHEPTPASPLHSDAVLWREALSPHTAPRPGRKPRAEAVVHWSPLRIRKDGHDVTAVEIERSVKSPAKLRNKIAAHVSAIEIGAWDLVVWLVDDPSTARAVNRAMTATLDTFERRRQLVVSTHQIAADAARTALSGLNELPWASYGNPRTLNR